MLICVLLCFVFVGCVDDKDKTKDDPLLNGNYTTEQYKEYLEKDGYEIVIFTKEELSAPNVYFIDFEYIMGRELEGRLEYIVIGSKDGYENTFIKFEKETDASLLRGKI